MFGHRHGDRHARGGMFGRGAGGFGGHRHGGGHSGRLGRFFDHGDLRYVLLGLIAERPRHGYELIKAIEEKFGGAYSPSPGVIYPTLSLLEELGYIQPDSPQGPRKEFVITPEGTAFLAANQAVVDQIFSRMAEIGHAYAGGPAPEIRRAMRNLEAALMIRLGRGPLTTDQVRGVTAVLDRAASEIEQG
ncbi:MAG: PadR family transcriptional regulator [Alphaproteobacteria bacterium]|nr:PadR family transcriptional regulator [Alphaproteobacteria bacterium]